MCSVFVLTPSLWLNVARIPRWLAPDIGAPGTVEKRSLVVRHHRKGPLAWSARLWVTVDRSAIVVLRGRRQRQSASALTGGRRGEAHFEEQTIAWRVGTLPHRSAMAERLREDHRTAFRGCDVSDEGAANRKHLLAPLLGHLEVTFVRAGDCVNQSLVEAGGAGMELGRGLTAAKPAVLLGDVLQREAHRREARRDLALHDLVAEADTAASRRI